MLPVVLNKRDQERSTSSEESGAWSEKGEERKEVGSTKPEGMEVSKPNFFFKPGTDRKEGAKRGKGQR